MKKVNIQVTLNIVAIVEESYEDASVDNILDCIEITANGDEEFVEVESCEIKDFHSIAWWWCLKI